MWKEEKEDKEVSPYKESFKENTQDLEASWKKQKKASRSETQSRDGQANKESVIMPVNKKNKKKTTYNGETKTHKSAAAAKKYSMAQKKSPPVARRAVKKGKGSKYA